MSRAKSTGGAAALNAGRTAKAAKKERSRCTIERRPNRVPPAPPVARGRVRVPANQRCGRTRRVPVRPDTGIARPLRHADRTLRDDRSRSGPADSAGVVSVLPRRSDARSEIAACRVARRRTPSTTAPAHSTSGGRVRRRDDRKGGRLDDLRTDMPMRRVMVKADPMGSAKPRPRFRRRSAPASRRFPGAWGSGCGIGWPTARRRSTSKWCERSPRRRSACWLRRSRPRA